MIYVVFSTKAMILKTLFPTYKYIILTPYVEVLDGNSFSNYRMGKILFTQNSFENTCMGMECRDVGVEVKKWRMVMFIKNALCALVLTSTSRYSVRPHLPTYGKGRSHTICSY